MNLDALKSKMLSGEELKTAIPDSTLYIHSQLKNFTNIRQLFRGTVPNVCFILYEWGQDNGAISGHWCLVIEHLNDILMFDPYGASLTEQWNYVKGHFKTEPYLINLLNKSGMKVYNNTEQYQGKGYEINTCGRWCILRAMYESLNEEQFYNRVVELCHEMRLSPDNMVTKLTYDLFGF